MSTRANIIVKDSNSTVYLYRHCDGYPGGLGSELNWFLNSINNSYLSSVADIVERLLVGNVADGEYTTHIHGDVEYKYIIEVQETPKLRSFERINYGIHKTTEDEAWQEIFPEF